MPAHTFSLAALTALFGLSFPPLVSREKDAALSEVEFSKLHRQLTSIKEPWQSIPWRLSLLEAQADAVRDKKPIYMLVRSGHPLGCV